MRLAPRGVHARLLATGTPLATLAAPQALLQDDMTVVQHAVQTSATAVDSAHKANGHLPQSVETRQPLIMALVANPRAHFNVVESGVYDDGHQRVDVLARETAAAGEASRQMPAPPHSPKTTPSFAVVDDHEQAIARAHMQQSWRSGAAHFDTVPCEPLSSKSIALDGERRQEEREQERRAQRELRRSQREASPTKSLRATADTGAAT